MEQKTCLVILDGWGHAKPSMHNAITSAHTPFYNDLVRTELFTTLHAGAEHLDLPAGQFGNSEIGHMTIGAGRVFPSDLRRINEQLEQNSLSLPPQNTHLIGLFSNGGVHSHNQHIFLLLKRLIHDTANKIFLHIITDGRDRPIHAFKEDFQPILSLCNNHPDRIVISTIGGRYFGMDRDKNWDRTNAYMQQIQSAKGSTSFLSWLKDYPHNDRSDEFIQPISFAHTPILDSDNVICCNFRADRALQILKKIEELKPHTLLGLTSYPGFSNIKNLFPKTLPTHGLGQVVSDNHIQQIRIAETEKFAHVTYFFNMLNDKPYPQEERLLIPSEKVASFDQSPKMRAKEITEAVIQNMPKYGLTVCNFANADMVGHTGNAEATIKAVEYLDTCLGQIFKQCLLTGTALVITADHGNADEMRLENGEVSTSHSLAMVPLIICNTRFKALLKDEHHNLSCIAPTILDIMGLEKPKQMQSHSILLCK
ncbi:MAG: phosphoglycerate mutase (2,3-diphosphoglycerate-independent) [Gammaproteobacteria bacterium]|nr:phosphoglycerate mutase (2,3-diphosphoglycerate-independent) [Gammaproteobacteria bacterium]